MADSAMVMMHGEGKRAQGWGEGGGELASGWGPIHESRELTNAG